MSLSYSDVLPAWPRPVGAGALDPARDTMSPPADRFDRYAAGPEADAVAGDRHLMPDSRGNVATRVTDQPVVAAWVGPMDGRRRHDGADPRRTGRPTADQVHRPRPGVRA